MDGTLLDLSLEVAVPLWQDRHASTPVDRRHERARELADVVASKGDVIMFKSKRKGETAAAFNALAEGIALASYQPGGVQFRGRTWEATP